MCPSLKFIVELKCVHQMFTTTILLVVKVLLMHLAVKETKHVQSKFQPETMLNVKEKVTHQLISSLNILALKVNFLEIQFFLIDHSFDSDYYLVYTMCTDTEPLRNTLYGFIVSPGYPHPMADNLKCSISIGKQKQKFLLFRA